jgi:hypothetical protein
MAKVLLACHHDMVQAFPPDRADQPLGVPVLPWRACRCRMIANANYSKQNHFHVAISRRRLQGVGTIARFETKNKIILAE